MKGNNAMTYTYTMNKSKFSGWKATTEIDLGPCDLDNKPARRVLVIDTSKSTKKTGYLSTFANVSMVQSEEYEGRIIERRLTAIFSDFCGYVQHEPAKSATEKAVKTAHEKAMKTFDEVKANALRFYAEGKAKI